MTVEKITKAILKNAVIRNGILRESLLNDGFKSVFDYITKCQIYEIANIYICDNNITLDRDIAVSQVKKFIADNFDEILDLIAKKFDNAYGTLLGMRVKEWRKEK